MSRWLLSEELCVQWVQDDDITSIVLLNLIHVYDDVHFLQDHWSVWVICVTRLMCALTLVLRVPMAGVRACRDTVSELLAILVVRQCPSWFNYALLLWLSKSNLILKGSRLHNDFVNDIEFAEPLGRLGMPCLPSLKCVDYNTECFGDVCLCQAGYFNRSLTCGNLICNLMCSIKITIPYV